MADDTLDFHGKALGLQAVVWKMPADLPSQREVRIQIDKLRRMAEAFDKKFPWTLTLQMPVEKLRRKKGPDLHRLAQQSKRLDVGMAKLWEEWLRSELPDLDYGARKKIPAASREFVRVVNKNIYDGIQQLRLSATKAATKEAEEGLRGIKRLSPGSRRSR